MSSAKSINVLTTNKLFNGTDFSTLNFSFDQNNFEELNEGTIIYSSGEESKYVYLIIQGQVKIKQSSVKRLLLKSDGDFFGEEETLEGTVRKSSAMANNKCILYKIEKDILNKLVSSSPQVKNIIFGRNGNSPKERDDSNPFLQNLDISTDPVKLDINKVTEPAQQDFTNNLIEDNTPPESESELHIETESVQHSFDTASNNEGEQIKNDNNNLANDPIYRIPPEIDYELVDQSEENSPIEILEVINSKNEQSVENTFHDSELKKYEIQLQASSDLKKTAKDLLHFLLKETDSDVGAIYLYDAANNRLEDYFQTNESFYKSKRPLKYGITACVAKDKRIRFAVSYLNDPDYNQEIDRPNDFTGTTIIFIPLLNDKNNLLGIAQIGNDQSEFNHDEEKRIKRVVDYCSKVFQESITSKDTVAETPEIKNSQLNLLTNFILEDVRAPLLNIKQYAVILSRFDLLEEVKKVISHLSAQSNSIIDVIQSSIDFSENKNNFILEDNSFNDVITQILTLLSDYVESRNVKLFKKLSADVNIKIDTRKFYVACYYIAKFACDMMPQGGKIYFSNQIDDYNVDLIIKDESTGISKDIADKIFDLFYTDNQQEKVGLGLAISRYILEGMQGKLKIESSETGIKYLISLPKLSDRYVNEF